MDIFSIYYCAYYNQFIDQNGDIVYNIFRLVQQSKIFLFKKLKGTYYVPSKHHKNLVYELVFPLEGDEDEYF